MRNFARINNYYNRKEAWNDWYKLAAEVEREGYRDLLTQYAPPTNAGWRTIDKCIAKVRKAFNEALRIDRFLELVDTCLADPAHDAIASIAEATDTVFGQAQDANWYAEMEAQSADANDLRATEEGARI